MHWHADNLLRASLNFSFFWSSFSIDARCNTLNGCVSNCQHHAACPLYLSYESSLRRCWCSPEFSFKYSSLSTNNTSNGVTLVCHVRNHYRICLLYTSDAADERSS